MEGGVSIFPGMIILNLYNYSDWKINMEDLLIVKDLYEPIAKEQISTGVLESDVSSWTGRQWPPSDNVWT